MGLITIIILSLLLLVVINDNNIIPLATFTQCYNFLCIYLPSATPTQWDACLCKSKTKYVVYTLQNCWTQQKIPGSVKKWKVPGKLFITTVSKKNVRKKSVDDNDGFQQQFPQRFVDEYEHMNGRNDQLMMRLKAIEAEYYSIKN